MFVSDQKFSSAENVKHKLCKKCPYSELFWSVYSSIQTEYGEIPDTEYLCVFSPNVGKYGPE